MSKYAEFDALLIGKIRGGSSTFTALCSKEMLISADAFAKADRFGHKTAWRVIDRRLQSLRKAGKIVYAKGDWSVRTSGGAA